MRLLIDGCVIFGFDGSLLWLFCKVMFFVVYYGFIVIGNVEVVDSFVIIFFEVVFLV